MIYLAAVLIVGLLVWLNRRDTKRSTSSPQWRIAWSPGMPERPTPHGSGWYFDFPTNPGHHVHYVQRFGPQKLGRTLTVRFAITGGGFVPQQFPDRPALVSLLIQRRGDNWGAQGAYAAYRWYSHAHVALTEGEFTLSVPLDVSAWGDVFNKQDPAAFAAALREVDNIGLVFGSAGGLGHGVYATQPARFTLIDMNFGP